MTAATGKPPRQPSRRGTIVAVLITVLGPAIGTLVLLGAGVIRILVGEGNAAMAALNLGTLSGIVMFFGVFAYVTAGVPALFCGVYLGWFTNRHGTFPRWRAVAAAIVATLAGTGVMDIAMRTRGQEGSLLPLLVLLLPIAAVTALVCRSILIRVGILQTESPLVRTTSLADH